MRNSIFLSVRTKKGGQWLDRDVSESVIPIWASVLNFEKSRAIERYWEECNGPGCYALLQFTQRCHSRAYASWGAVLIHIYQYIYQDTYQGQVSRETVYFKEESCRTKQPRNAAQYGDAWRTFDQGWREDQRAGGMNQWRNEWALLFETLWNMKPYWIPIGARWFPSVRLSATPCLGFRIEITSYVHFIASPRFCPHGYVEPLNVLIIVDYTNVGRAVTVHAVHSPLSWSQHTYGVGAIDLVAQIDASTFVSLYRKESYLFGSDMKSTSTRRSQGSCFTRSWASLLLFKFILTTFRVLSLQRPLSVLSSWA